jgi:hypothetical protein
MDTHFGAEKSTIFIGCARDCSDAGATLLARFRYRGPRESLIGGQLRPLPVFQDFERPAPPAV